ncbi:MAG: cyclic nucleotide-binding domain-containing protein [Lachnospiraceae bacterium]|nr:cyclic nucleotide-binding domain-containing protein [Lachnospiraceae bacterium]
MAMKLKINGMNEITKGTEIFHEGDPVDCICAVLKGRVELHNQGSRILFGNGSFLGVQDLYMGRCLSSCTAVEDSVVYAFPAGGLPAVDRILAANKDYRGLLMYSVVKHVNSLYRAREEFVSEAEKTYAWLLDCRQEYLRLARQSGDASMQQMPGEPAAPDASSTLDAKKLNFYIERAQVPLDIMKSFYGCSAGLTLFPLEQAAGVCAELMIECYELTEYIVSLLDCLVSDQEGGLFSRVIRLAMRVQNVKGAEETFRVLSRRADECMDHINVLDTLLEKKTGRQSVVDRGKIEKLYVALLTGVHPEEKDGQQAEKAEEKPAVQENGLVLLDNSLEQIVKFAGYDAEKAEQLRILIGSFEALSDRSSSDDQARKLRHGISTLFYDLYETTFCQALGMEELPKPVGLFLNFGFLSEKLLEPQEKNYLLSCAGTSFTGPYKGGRIYTIREWLTAVYEGKREPSKNDMDMDYTDYVRSQRKAKQITEAQEREMMVDQRRKLSYEIHNMFQANNRIVNGQISTFVPVLHHGMFVQGPAGTLLDCAKLGAVIEKLKLIDYSVFYRDVMYSKPEQGIDKIWVMREYCPDIILMPTVGTRTSMWQECAGKRRESAGRFVLPVFFEEDLESAMTKLFGRFRWELCRFLQGGSWNNIKYRSLTSEYCDYIQFYKKNRDLSEEKKEKLKQQIQKAKGNSREIFVMDYELWVRNESAGAIRLNKLARDILAMYCPFSKDIRTRLASQPMFEEAMARPARERAKSAHEMDLRIRQLLRDPKTKGEVPQEVLDTLSYFQNS